MKETVLPDTLPDDPAELKKILLDQMDIIKTYESKISDKEREYAALDEKYRLLKHVVYGIKSEKTTVADDDDQLFLFNEAETGVTLLEDEVLAGYEKEEKEALQDEQKALFEHETRKKATSKRQKKTGGKITFPADLPRERVVHDLSEAEKAGRPFMREEYTEELDIKVEMRVLRHVYPIYGEKKDAGEGEQPVASAKRPERILPGCQYSDNFIAHTLVQKFADGLPFYRQEQIHKKRHDVTVHRSRMCYWGIKIGGKLERLTELMKQDIRGGPLIQMDETTVQVLKEKGRDPHTKSYMWITVGTTKQYKKIILFYYFQGRSGSIPPALLEDYVGYLQTDGYEGYNQIAAKPGISHIGCWAHVRRRFEKAERISKKGKSEKVALSFIRQLYFAEEKYRAMLEEGTISEQDFVEQRKKTSLPILTKFKKWLEGKKLNVTPKSKLGEAVSYALGQWPTLTGFLDTSYATPDNNFCENAIRPFVIGRKAWLFFDTPLGAYASATLYSLIETAKANGLDPYKYLVYVLGHFPLAKTEEDLRKLLPYNLVSDDIDTISEN